MTMYDTFIYAAVFASGACAGWFSLLALQSHNKARQVAVTAAKRNATRRKNREAAKHAVPKQQHVVHPFQ